MSQFNQNNQDQLLHHLYQFIFSSIFYFQLLYKVFLLQMLNFLYFYWKKYFYFLFLHFIQVNLALFFCFLSCVCIFSKLIFNIAVFYTVTTFTLLFILHFLTFFLSIKHQLTLFVLICNNFLKIHITLTFNSSFVKRTIICGHIRT